MTTTELFPVEPPTAAPPLIDYSTLDVDVANQMRDRARRIQRLQRASVLDVGRELIAAKELVEHGWFRGWVETACQIHIRTAERLMQAAQENPAITESLSRFRDAASKASDTERQRFLDFTAPQAA